ncbi:MAG: hypothetical protein AAFQ15_01255 [Pseudomonadota bacterium]
MADKNALDLSSIDPPIWRIMVEGAVYGPYTFGQLQSFAAEGRLNEASKVANGDGGAFLVARSHSELASLFQAQPTMSAPNELEEASNYFLTLQTDGDGRRAVIMFLNEVGTFSELMPGSFILTSTQTIVELRAQLSTVLAERGRCVIVNARTGQLAWMGLKPDADAHAKLIWKRD